jgi:hypothetical protein
MVSVKWVVLLKHITIDNHKRVMGACFNGKQRGGAF